MLKNTQINISAYEMEVIQKSFTSTLKWLEFYIEKSGYSGNWKRQILETIKRQDLNDQPSEIKGFMETALLGLDGMIKDKPNFVLENLQEQFYSWLDKSGIEVNRCWEELAESLVDINKVLTNEGEEFAERTSKEASENIAKMTPEERRQKFNRTFTVAQRLMETASARQKSLEGQTYKDIDMSNKFSGNSDQGKEIFNQINDRKSNLKGSELAATYDDRTLEEKFQEACEKLRTGITPGSWETSEGIKEWIFQLETERIRRHADQWEIKRVTTLTAGHYGLRYRNEESRLALVHKSVDLMDARNYVLGNLSIDQRKLFLEGTYPFEKLARPQLNRTGSEASYRKNYSQQLVLKDQISQSTKADDNPSKLKEATPVIIGVVGLTALLGGIIIYKVKKNKIKK